MGVKLGSGDVSFRLGSATPAKVYRGATQVWSAVTVPGAPTINYAQGNADPAVCEAEFLAPASDGGSPITGYLFYWDGSATPTEPDSLLEGEPGTYVVTFFGDPRCDEQLEIRAVNSIGAGSPATTTVFC